MFDPYHKWLGIKPGQRPPTYYQLLGIEPDEQDPEVIEEAAVRQTTHLRAYQIGAHADDCTRLLNEIAQARTILLNPAKRKAYDATRLQKSARSHEVIAREPPALLRTAPPPMPATAAYLERGQPVPSIVTGDPQPIVRNMRRVNIRNKEGRFLGRNKVLILAGVTGGFAGLALLLVVLLLPSAAERPARVQPGVDLHVAPHQPDPGQEKPVANPNLRPIDHPPPQPRDNAAPPPLVQPAPLPPVAGKALTGMFAGHQGPVHVAELAPDGQRLLTAGADNTLRLWDVPTGKSLAVVPYPVRLNCLAIAPNSRQALVGTAAYPPPAPNRVPPSALRMIELDSAREILSFHLASFAVESVAFSADGSKVASTGGLTGGNRGIDLWDATGKMVSQAGGSGMRVVRRLSFSADGNKILYYGADPALRAWNLQHAGHPEVLIPQASIVPAFAPGHRYIAFMSAFVVRVYSLESFQEVGSCRVPADAECLAVTPDGHYAIAAYRNFQAPDGKMVKGVVQLLDMTQGRPAGYFMGHTDDVLHLSVSADGHTLITASKDGTVRLWDVSRPTGPAVPAPANVAAPAPPRQDPPGPVTPGPPRRLAADWNPAGRLAFSPDNRRLLFGAQDATVRLHDVTTGAELRRFVGHTQSVLAVAFAPDGVHALSGAGDNTLRLWEVETGRQVRLFQSHTAPVTAVVFTPDGRSALSASQDHTVRLWDVSTGQELHRFEGHTGPVAALTLSRDGQYAASGGEDKLVIIWNVSKRREVGHIRANGIQHGISDLELFPDGERLLSCSGFKDALVWPFKVNGNRPAQPLRGHTDKVVTASLSGDGRLALSGSYDRTARLWDVASGRELCCLEGHAAPVTRVVLSPHGRYALTGSGDQIVRLWQLTRRP
jgi:WD40 repeat protein